MTSELAERALGILQAHWRPDVGYCVPNPAAYPHQWLWDSAFHAVAWARLGDERGVEELGSLMDGQLECGMVPHMRYGPTPPSAWLGPLASSSSITQPPMFGHAIAELVRSGFAVPADDLIRATRALRWILDNRRDASGLIFIVHPWEAGNDHAPRWDGWGVPGTTPATYDQEARSQWNQELMRDVIIGDDGAASGSRRFVVCPAAFNAYVAFNARELATVTGDSVLRRDADELAGADRRVALGRGDEPVGRSSGGRRGRAQPPDPDLRRGDAAAGVGRRRSRPPGAGHARAIRASSAARRTGRPTSPRITPATTHRRTGVARPGPT